MIVVRCTGQERSEHDEAMATLCSLAQSLGPDFAVFATSIVAQLKQLGIAGPLIDALILSPSQQTLAGTTASEPASWGKLSGCACPGNAYLLDDADDGVRGSSHRQGISAGLQTPSFGQTSLKAAWEATQHSTRADWHEWMRRLSVEMLRQSPSSALRACAELAHAYQPLARELFNAAFLSCWSELGEEGYQESLVASLETVLDAENMSLEVLQPLLNLAEFMELVDKPLPIDIRKLGALAEKCHAYAKALHYREVEFHTYPADTIEALISINNHLQQPEAAKGILTYAWQLYQVELKESWYEKLQRWTDARLAYERKQREDPGNLAWTVGCMRCHHALGDWETLCNLAQDTWRMEELEHDISSRAEVARLAAAAAWNLRKWDEMELYCASMPEDNAETSLFRAVLAVHTRRFSAAQNHIDQARRQLDSEFTALVGESYHRAYRVMISVLQLAELEEIIQHKEHPYAMPLSLLVRMWQHRIGQVQRDADVWQEILSVRYLAVPPANDPRTWLKFCSLCRKSGRSSLSR